MKNLTFACLDQPYWIKTQKQPDVVKTASNCTKWRRPENANVLTPYVCKYFMIIILNYAIIRSYLVAVATSRRVAKLPNYYATTDAFCACYVVIPGAEISVQE
jgi:hypothetical protein